MARKSQHSFLKDQRGAVAATYALALLPLVAIAGLAFDYTRVAGMETELQNAADQAALAGATQLDRTSGSMARAIAAIQGGLVSNSTAFANDGSGRTVNITDGTTQVIFYESKADAEAGTNGFLQGDASKGDADAAFVEVVVDTRDANYSLTSVVGAIKGSLNARAVAGLGSALCRIPPLMICNPDEADRDIGGNPNSVFDAVGRRGDGIKVVEGPTGAGPSYWEPGDYGFLDLGAGADAVAKGLGWISPDGNCISVEGNETIAPDTEPGLKAGAIDSINTRFDIYQNNSTCKAGGDCPAAFNSRKDLIRKAEDTPASNTNACSIHNKGWQETSGTKYLPTSATIPWATTPSAMGHPRDMCHAVSSAGSCTEGKFGDGNWDRDAYFRTNYLRTSAGSGGAAGTRWTQADWQYNLTHGADALPTGTTEPTRYEVYLWEVAREGDVVDGVTILATAPPGASGTTEISQSKPICSQHNGYSGTMTDPDRRVMTVAVVNCTAEKVKGKTKDVKIATWIDVFLVEPSASRTRTSASDIYMEVIRENELNANGTVGGLLIRRDVPYLVK